MPTIDWPRTEQQIPILDGWGWGRDAIDPLACGQGKSGHGRGDAVRSRRLQFAEEATHDEVLTLIEQRQLIGGGLGIVRANRWGEEPAAESAAEVVRPAS